MQALPPAVTAPLMVGIDYGTITSNVLTSYGDGWGIMWLKHGLNVDDLRALLEVGESEKS